jgi:hypothetical protein
VAWLLPLPDRLDQPRTLPTLPVGAGIFLPFLRLQLLSERGTIFVLPELDYVVSSTADNVACSSTRIVVSLGGISRSPCHRQEASKGSRFTSLGGSRTTKVLSELIL